MFYANDELDLLRLIALIDYVGLWYTELLF